MRGSAGKKLGATGATVHCIWETHVHHSHLHRVLSHWIVPAHVNEPQCGSTGSQGLSGCAKAILCTTCNGKALLWLQYSTTQWIELPFWVFQWKCNHSYSGPTSQTTIAVAKVPYFHPATGITEIPSTRPAIGMPCPTENCGDVCGALAR